LNNNNLYKNSAIFLAAIILTGGIFGIYSSPLTAFGEKYQSAKCDNTNVNINGIDQDQIQRQDAKDNLSNEPGLTGQELIPENAMNPLTGNNGNGDDEPLLDIERNIVNLCINDNENELTGIFRGEQNQNNNPLTCQECFTENLEPIQITRLQTFLANTDFVDLDGFCEFLSDPAIPNDDKSNTVLLVLVLIVGVSDIDQINRILECLGFEPLDPTS
jgi:hypothetical protein